MLRLVPLLGVHCARRAAFVISPHSRIAPSILLGTVGTKQQPIPSRVVEWARLASTTTEPKGQVRPSLKAVLRKFYMLVHPDRFSDHPKEKDVNEHSMKLFLSYMQEYKRRPFASPLGTPKRIPLTFYVKIGDEAKPTLRKVESDLVLNASNPQAAKKRLESLFNACGVDATDFEVGSSMESITAPDGASLQTFLARGIPAARNTLKQAVVDTAEIHKISAEIERSTHMRLSIVTGHESTFSSTENKQILQRFKELVETLFKTNDILPLIAGVEVDFDSDVEWSQVSSDGVVMLCRTENLEQWITFFHKQDWKEVAERCRVSRKTAIEEERRNNTVDAARKLKETQVASAIGLRAFELKVFSKFEYQSSVDAESEVVTKQQEEEEAEKLSANIDHYDKLVDKFLDSLLASKTLLGSLKNQFGKKLLNLELFYAPNMPDAVKYHLAPIGTLQISTSNTPKEFVELIKLHGKRAIQLAREEATWEGVRDFVEVRLGLKLLTVDYTFFHMVPNAVDKSRQALKKLEQAADSLRAQYMSGLMIAISDHYAVSYDGTIYIKWDFKSEDVIMFIQSVSEQK